MFYIQELIEVDPDKKDMEWAGRLIQHFRMYQQKLVDPATRKKHMDVILSRFDMEEIKKMFKDPTKLGMTFIPLCIMEKVRNILIGERLNADLNVELNANDPTASSQRERDASLLRNRADGEALITALNKQIGLPEFNFSQDKKLKGKSIFQGNTELFDDMGLNAQTDAHVSYFFKVWHRLLCEIRGQDVINFVFDFNEMKANIPKWVNDILSDKVIAAQQYVNEITGALMVNYLDPSKVAIIPGKREDGKDAVCLSVENVVTVNDVIKKMGNRFDMHQELPYLLQAVNYSNNSDYTGIWDHQQRVLCGDSENPQSNFISYNEFLNFKVTLGYIEWKSLDAKAFKMGVDYHGNLRMYEKRMAYQPTDEDGGYAKDVWYEENTYKSWYLPLSTLTQRLYQYGKLYHQAVEGAEDEYSCYSIVIRKEVGPSVAQVAEPYITMIQEAFTKKRWMIRRAKPKGRTYNVESLVQIAQSLFPEPGDVRTKIGQVMGLFEEGINELYTIPTKGGQVMGGGANPNADLPNGADPSIMTFKEVIEWGISNIKSDLGINDIRDAYSPQQNDTYKLEMQTLESSRNATAYIEFMLDNMLKNIATHTLTLTQDIIRYKNSLPYRFIQRAVGDNAIRDLHDLDGVALHRYGIFVNSFANFMDRKRVAMDTEQAWQNKEISYEVKMLLDTIKDYRKAAFVLSFEKNRAMAREDQQAAAEHQREMELEQMKQQMELKKIDLKGQWDYKKEDRKGYWYFMGYKLNAQSRITQQDMRDQHKADEIQQKAGADITRDQAKESIANQQPAM